MDWSFWSFSGAVLVLGLDVGEEIPINGLIATIIALLAITTNNLAKKIK